MKNEIKRGQLVIANTTISAMAQATINNGVLKGHEVPIMAKDTGRVVEAEGDRLLVNWRGRSDLFGWVDLDCVDVAETHSFENVTLFVKGEFFGVQSIFCKTLLIERAPYAQYDKATKITMRQPRQRRNRAKYLAFDQALAVVDGKAEAFENFDAPKASTVPGMTVSTGRYSSCDSRWTDDMIAHAKQAGKVLYMQNTAGEVVQE